MSALPTGTNSEKLLAYIEKEGRPLQRKEFQARIKINKNSLGTAIFLACESGHIKKLKYPGMPIFYTHPDWVCDGELCEGYEFNPITRKFKTPIDESIS